MKRYHRLDVARPLSTDKREYKAPAPVDTSKASAIIQYLLDRQGIEETKWGLGITALRCARCRAIYRHDTTDLSHCLCCGQPLTTVRYTA